MMVYNSAGSLILDQTETPSFSLVNNGWYYIVAIIEVTAKTSQMLICNRADGTVWTAPKRTLIGTVNPSCSADIILGMHNNQYYYAGGFDDWFIETESQLAIEDLARYFRQAILANGGDTSGAVDGRGELLITIMSSQRRRRAAPFRRTVLGVKRKRFSDGKVCVPYSRFLGYDRGEEGGLVINEEEAVIVRLIYKMFLESCTPHTIAKYLTEQGIPSPGGKAKWNSSTIRSILSNEKMKGDALLQKSCTVDFLTKKKKMNEGEIPQYYVENS
jgi:hypothetical protein